MAGRMSPTVLQFAADSLLHLAYIRRYFGPLPPSRGVQRGPSTSVALQSTQLGAFTLSSSPARS